MRRTMYWRVAVFAATVFGGSSVPLPGGLELFGVSSAEAKTYYTRKRVNGRWITGRFPKKSFTRSNAAASSSRSGKRRIVESVEADTGPATRHASLPPPDATPAIAQMPSPTLAQTVPPQVPRAAQVASPGPASEQLVPLSEDERLSKLREALRARANSLTTGTLGPAPAVRPAPEPQSVSLDFITGTKTTIFTDGTSIQEPFDVGALRGLAASPPHGGLK